MSRREVKQWQRFEYVGQVSDDPRHFTDSWLTATFIHDELAQTVYGFYNDNG